jgi:hypothetical protein
MKMVSKPRNLVLVVVVLALWPGSSSAAIIEIGLTAEITYIEDDDGLLKGQLSVGDLITGSYTYDSDTPDSHPGEGVGEYWHDSPPFGIRLGAGGFAFQTDPDNIEFLISVVNDNVGADSYLLRSDRNLPLYDGVFVVDIEWQLNDYSGAALSSDALPLEPPVLEDWPDTWYGLGISGSTGDPRGPQYFMRSTVTSVWLVPEPGTALLFGLGGLALLRKRRSALRNPVAGKSM